MRRVCSSLIVVLCVLPCTVYAQKATPEFRRDTHAIRRIAWNVMNEGDNKPEILSDWRDVDDPQHTVLILLGDLQSTDVLDRFPLRNGLAEFVFRGGSVLIATDHSLVHPMLSSISGYAVSGRRVTGFHQFRRPRRWEVGLSKRDRAKVLYKNQRDCIALTSSLTNPSELFLKPDLENNTFFLRLVTNRPSFLQRSVRSVPNRVKKLVSFPRGCYYEDEGYLSLVTPLRWFGLTTEFGRGRLMLLADHSIFINEMLLQEDKAVDTTDDIGNVTFAYNALEWLRGDEQQRNKVMFVIDGRIESELNIPLIQQPITLKELEAQVAAGGNALVKKFNEEETTINRGMIKGLGRGPGRMLFGRRNWYRNWFLLLIMIVTLAFGFYGFRRLRRATHHIESGVPLLATALERNEPERNQVLSRQESLLESNILTSQAKEAAKEFFQEFIGINLDAELKLTVAIQGGWWQRWSWKRRVFQLWNFALGKLKWTVSVRGFRGILNQIDQVKRAVDTGQIQVKVIEEDGYESSSSREQSTSHERSRP